MSPGTKDALFRAVKTTWQSFVAAVPATSIAFDASTVHKVEVSAALAVSAGITSFLTNVGTVGQVATVDVSAFDDGGAG